MLLNDEQRAELLSIVQNEVDAGYQSVCDGVYDACNQMIDVLSPNIEGQDKKDLLKELMELVVVPDLYLEAN